MRESTLCRDFKKFKLMDINFDDRCNERQTVKLNSPSNFLAIRFVTSLVVVPFTSRL